MQPTPPRGRTIPTYRKTSCPCPDSEAGPKETETMTTTTKPKPKAKKAPAKKKATAKKKTAAKKTTKPKAASKKTAKPAAKTSAKYKKQTLTRRYKDEDFILHLAADGSCKVEGGRFKTAGKAFDSLTKAALEVTGANSISGPAFWRITK
jgi:outer membrane biosynthesis protein TonB